MSRKHGFPSVSENSKSCFTVPCGRESWAQGGRSRGTHTCSAGLPGRVRASTLRGSVALRGRQGLPSAGVASACRLGGTEQPGQHAETHVTSATEATSRDITRGGDSECHLLGVVQEASPHRSKSP